MKNLRRYLWLILPLALAGWALAGGGAKELTVNIIVKQQGDGALSATYRLSEAQDALRFETIDGGYRVRQWTPASPDFEIVREEDSDIIRRKDGAPFADLTLSAEPATERLKKNYQPISRYGESGMMVFTGHFWPLSPGGERLDAVFDFAPAAAGKVVAFGDYAERLDDWRSPMAHPAFVYMGPLAPVETPDVMAVMDPSVPEWISDAFYDLTPRSFGYLAERFGFSFNARPNLFLAAPLGEEEGRLSYSGDALPGQFQITLEGGAWREPSDKALSIFRYSTIHEAVHLWQAAARPGDEGADPWIHEGAADAIAAEAMLALGYWDGPAFERNFETAKANCAAQLKNGALSGAEERRDYRALYDCGHLIAVAVSRADGARVSDFWRAFIANVGDDGYDQDDFYALVRDRTGSRAFTQALRRFVSTPFASPDLEIDKFLAAAAAR